MKRKDFEGSSVSLQGQLVASDLPFVGPLENSRMRPGIVWRNLAHLQHTSHHNGNLLPLTQQFVSHFQGIGPLQDAVAIRGPKLTPPIPIIHAPLKISNIRDSKELLVSQVGLLPIKFPPKWQMSFTRFAMIKVVDLREGLGARPGLRR